MSVITTIEGKTATSEFNTSEFNTSEFNTSEFNTSEFNKMQMKILRSLDTRAKLRKHQESKIRDYYSHVFKNENNSLAKEGITIRSSIGALSKTRKKQGFKVQVKKMTLKSATETINLQSVSETNPTATISTI